MLLFLGKHLYRGKLQEDQLYVHEVQVLLFLGNVVGECMLAILAFQEQELLGSIRAEEAYGERDLDPNLLKEQILG